MLLYMAQNEGPNCLMSFGLRLPKPSIVGIKGVRAVSIVKKRTTRIPVWDFLECRTIKHTSKLNTI
jgi:hypothetical protein